MDYISVEEFLKQSEKVQEIFLNWWKDNCNKYDLFYRKPIYGRRKGVRQKYIIIKSQGYSLKTITLRNEEILFSKKDAQTEEWDIQCIDDIIPLLTETQLRKFIEEKTGKKVQSTVRPNNKYIIDLIGKRYKDEDINIWTDTDNLIQAYWQVAVKIIEEI